MEALKEKDMFRRMFAIRLKKAIKKRGMKQKDLA